jgi:hypothetical protein
MNTLYNLNIILGLQLTMGLPEIIILNWVPCTRLYHTFLLEFQKKFPYRRDPAHNRGISDNDNWKLKYYNDMDMQERAATTARSPFPGAGDRTDPHHGTGRNRKRTRRRPP